MLFFFIHSVEYVLGNREDMHSGRNYVPYEKVTHIRCISLFYSFLSSIKSQPILTSISIYPQINCKIPKAGIFKGN